MSPSVGQQDLFDDATEGRSAGDRTYIDQVDSATDEEELLSDTDDDVLFDKFDDLQVEDEDWEIAERGLFFSFSFALPPSQLSFGRLHQTVQSTPAARCRAISQ